jgi:predicted molibdopterin-dependent oxidoreductase YjgC
VERQGAPLRAGLAESPTAGLGVAGSDRPPTDDDGPARPTVSVGPVDVTPPHVAKNDSYSLRLVASRTLYDDGAAVTAVGALADLVSPAPLRANPHDLDDLGVAAGGSVRVRTSSASVVLSVVPDASLPRNVVAADFNVPLDQGTVADLIDSATPVVELRMETP